MQTRLYVEAKENEFSFAVFVHPIVFVDETVEIYESKNVAKVLPLLLSEDIDVFINVTKNS